MDQIWAALLGAVIGGLLAFGAAEWSFRRARGIAAAEADHKERAIFQGLIAEIHLAMEIAARASPTPLPTAYLNASMPLRVKMDEGEAVAVQSYAQAALRYNGRVARIVAYGMGKRASGKAPGSERPENHAEEVQRAGRLATEKLGELMDRQERR